MDEEWEKTIILIVTLLIIGGFYISPQVKKINMNYNFVLFIILFFISVITLNVLNKWNKDKKKTNYILIYYLYKLICIILFLYLIFLIGQNPKINKLKGGSNNINPIEYNVSSQNNNKLIEISKNVLNSSINGIAKGVSAYSNFWKKILFGKNNDVVEGIL